MQHFSARKKKKINKYKGEERGDGENKKNNTKVVGLTHEKMNSEQQWFYNSRHDVHQDEER